MVAPPLHEAARPVGCGNRYFPVGETRLPFDSLRSLDVREANDPPATPAETAVAIFKSRHPYLLFHRQDIARIRKASGGNPKALARFRDALHDQANSAPAEGKTRNGIKRQARRLINTSFLALIDNDNRAADALQVTRSLLGEFTSAASWRQRPVIKSFLDCAEISVAVSLAYDWLYDKLLTAEREEIEQSLLKHVLEPALAAYEDPKLLWPRRRDNCALVSNSGILLASLAMIERRPVLSTKLVGKSLASSRNVFEAFGPDGAWPEGLSYWSLAMRYASLMVAALESTFGQSLGLADRPGFAQTGDFALHAVGPFGAAFNFGDSEPQFDISTLAWFAHRFKRPIDAWLIDAYEGWYLPFSVVCVARPKKHSTAFNVRMGKVFHSGNLACFRNTWSKDPTARPVYVAIKGGNVPASRVGASPRPEDVILHTQADAGSFIVDGARQRWILDLGPDDYD